MELIGKRVRVVVNTETHGGGIQPLTIRGTLVSIEVVEPPLPEEPPVGSVVEVGTRLGTDRRYKCVTESGRLPWRSDTGIYISWEDLVSFARLHGHTIHLVRREEIPLDPAPAPEPRTFRTGDALPADLRAVTDADGDRWDRVGDSEEFTYSVDTPSVWEDILCIWGPVTEAA